MRFLRALTAVTMIVLTAPSMACSGECDSGYPPFGCMAAMEKNECGVCVVTSERGRYNCSSWGSERGGHGTRPPEEKRPVLPPLGGDDNGVDAGADADAEAEAGADADAEADAGAEADAEAETEAETAQADQP